MGEKLNPENFLPAGEVVNTTPAKLPVRTALVGQYVDLVPLDPSAHAESLYRGSHGAGREQYWRYLWDGPYADLSAFKSNLIRIAQTDDPLVFTILDNVSRAAVGMAAFWRMDPKNRVIEVGGILFTEFLQKTKGATEAMYLMARHVFDDLGYRRYEWKCNSFNEPSRKAALRLGFSFEGIFRQHMIIKSRSRDTAWFSMIDSEWPSRKSAFERWLDPENFDETGRQRLSLRELRDLNS